MDDGLDCGYLLCMSDSTVAVYAGDLISGRQWAHQLVDNRLGVLTLSHQGFALLHNGILFHFIMSKPTPGKDEDEEIPPPQRPPSPPPYTTFAARGVHVRSNL